MSISDKVHKYLEAGKRIEDDATPGPWFHFAHDEVRSKVHDCKGRGNIAITQPTGDDPAGYRAMANAALIADARERLPRYRRAIEEALSVLTNGVSAHASCNDEDGCLGAVVDDVIDSIERALLGEDKPNSNSGELTPS